jgi:hypothetical protein
MDTLTEKQHAHELINNLDASQIAPVLQLLESLAANPPCYTTAGAPMDDEPYTAEERKAVARSIEWLKHNEPIPHEQVLAELGLTMADWEEMGETPA